MDYEIFELPAFTNQAGVTLDLKLAYKTRGRLSTIGKHAIDQAVLELLEH
jgi:hypothetical protein